jgi:hydroxymethylbilane synthase
MNTMGDIDQIKPLSDFASKGVFTKELDVATLNDTIQLAVHCLKDLPTTLPPGLFMGAVMERGDTEDVLVLPLSHPKHQKGSLEDLPDGAVIGTSAMRRSASVAKYYPKLVCKNIRGNVNTRLAKLDRYALARLNQCGNEHCEPNIASCRTPTSQLCLWCFFSSFFFVCPRL